MAYCVDASAVVSLFLPLAGSQDARSFWTEALETGTRLIAPSLLYAETTSVFRRHVHLGAILHGEATAALRQLFRLPISSVHNREVYFRAMEFAQRLGHAKAYDVQYLAVAEMENATLVTVDGGMYENSRVLGIAARLLA